MIAPFNYNMKNTRELLFGFIIFIFIHSVSKCFLSPYVWSCRWNKVQQGSEKQMGTNHKRRFSHLLLSLVGRENFQTED